MPSHLIPLSRNRHPRAAHHVQLNERAVEALLWWVHSFLHSLLDNCLTIRPVFVHGYRRDADSAIHVGCVRETGLQAKRRPAHFLEGAYLRYAGWFLSGMVSRPALRHQQDVAACTPCKIRRWTKIALILCRHFRMARRP